MALITLVQLKEYRQHCVDELDYFIKQNNLKKLDCQAELFKKNIKYYEKEVARMDKKIANIEL